MTRGQLPQRAGLPGLNGGGAAAAVPPSTHFPQSVSQHNVEPLRYILHTHIVNTSTQLSHDGRSGSLETRSQNFGCLHLHLGAKIWHILLLCWEENSEVGLTLPKSDLWKITSWGTQHFLRERGRFVWSQQCILREGGFSATVLHTCMYIGIWQYCKQTTRPMTFMSRYKNIEKRGLWPLSCGVDFNQQMPPHACHIIVLL